MSEPKPFNIMGPVIPAGAKPPMGMRKRDDLNFLVAKVLDIDPEKQCFNVQGYNNTEDPIDVTVSLSQVPPPMSWVCLRRGLMSC
jgi:hypothetical protein